MPNLASFSVVIYSHSHFKQITFKRATFVPLFDGIIFVSRPFLQLLLVQASTQTKKLKP